MISFLENFLLLKLINKKICYYKINNYRFFTFHYDLSYF